jgi:alpha-beta hydrolase superfamily lysophospholipase
MKAMPAPSFLPGQAGQLAVYDWPALNPAPRGVVLIVHGLGEHAGRHASVARALREQGFAVRALDHQGHGQSDGPRGQLTSADGLLQDLASVIDNTRERPGLQGLPLILLGHSMGGLVVSRIVGEQWRYVDGLVMSSPALGIRTSPLQKLLLATLTRWLPDLTVDNGLNPRLIARDPKVVAAYLQDPLVHSRISARLGKWIVQQGRKTRSQAHDWQVPSLLLYAGQDRLVDPEASAAFAQAAPTALVHSHCFHPMYHEIFHDPQRHLVFAVLKRWLDERFPA